MLDRPGIDIAKGAQFIQSSLEGERIGACKSASVDSRRAAARRRGEAVLVNLKRGRNNRWVRQ
jgi:hypothetical protein